MYIHVHVHVCLEWGLLQAEVRRLSAANDEIPELRKRMRSLEESQETHNTTVTQLEVRDGDVKSL